MSVTYLSLLKLGCCSRKILCQGL